jgi:hypothetical protein
MAEEPANDLTAELAAKVLKADLRNNIAAVAAGTRLPETARSRFEQAALGAADPKDLHAERIGSLIKIFVRGRPRLTAAEKKEIIDSGALPAEVLDAVADPDPVLPEAAAPPKTTVPNYQQTYAHYGKLYGRGERMIKKWVAWGRKTNPPDLPPLDDPPKMLAWWNRRKTCVAPDELVAHARAATDPASPTKHEEPSTKTNPPLSAPPLSTALASTAQLGFLGALQRQREAEANSGSLYNVLLRRAAEPELTDEQRATRLAAAEQARRTWDDHAKSLREFERDAEKILAATGRTWLADDVLAAVTQIHANVAAGLRQLGARVRPALTADQLASHDTELQRILDGLRALKFASAPSLPAAA